MFKKVVSILTVVAAIGVSGQVSYAASPVSQNSWNTTSVSQFESVSGSAQITQFQNSSKNTLQTQVASTGGGAQGQSTNITGSQVQAGLTSGPAQFSQSGTVWVNQGDEQTFTSGSKQKEVTGVQNHVSQTTTTPSESLVVQAQVNHVAASHFQIAIPSGATSIQNQNTQVLSSQFQATITKPTSLQ